MFFLSLTLYGQDQLFYLGDTDVPSATKEKKNTIELILNKKVFNNILKNRVKSEVIEIPFITGKLKLKLDSSCTKNLRAYSYIGSSILNGCVIII